MKKMLASTMTVLMMGTMIACSSQTGSTPNTTKETQSPSANNTVTTYPIKTDKTLTYWGELTGNLTGVKTTHAEVPFFQDWQKKTGVQLKFSAPPTGQAKEALNV
ncbi:MAG: extracellular solute-binding protein family 1, partial [Paenibacillus sp.]|nr:extracellular solute-binding protein family 1 [Paenibacillus sp.]